MDYVEIDDAISADGLRLILVRGFPSPWGQAAKAMMEYKRLTFIKGPQDPRSTNDELMAWSGTNSGPVVAWNDEPPLNRWNDILLLLERLAPAPALMPEDMDERIVAFGLAHEICGELGFGWNCRLNMARPPTPDALPSPFALKYGYNARDGERAEARVISLMMHLAERLRLQHTAGSQYLVGNGVTAVDFYWAAFSNLVCIQTPELCPLHPKIRPNFEKVPPTVRDAIDPILISHRDFIMEKYFKLPMAL